MNLLDQPESDSDQSLNLANNGAAQMSAQITAATAALHRAGQGEIAAEAFVAGLSPDDVLARSTMASVIAELAEKQTERIAMIVYGALRVLRNRGVRLDRHHEDEIEEAVLEHTSRTTGLGNVPDTLTMQVPQ